MNTFRGVAFGAGIEKVSHTHYELLTSIATNYVFIVTKINEGYQHTIPLGASAVAPLRRSHCMLC